jgi:hypothetical protein
VDKSNDKPGRDFMSMDFPRSMYPSDAEYKRAHSVYHEDISELSINILLDIAQKYLYETSNRVTLFVCDNDAKYLVRHKGKIYIAPKNHDIGTAFGINIIVDPNLRNSFFVVEETEG